MTPRRSAAGRQVDHLVVGAAQLEAEHRLQILALEQDLRPEPRRQLGRRIERRLDGHVVDAGVQDATEVRFGGHAPTIRAERPTDERRGSGNDGGGRLAAGDARREDRAIVVQQLNRRRAISDWASRLPEMVRPADAVTCAAGA